MKANYLPVAVKNSGVALEELLPHVLKAPPTAKAYLYVCTLYRRLATGWMLMASDPEPFFANLFKSARAFVYFLAHAPDAEKVTSRAEPFFDAVACRDAEAVRAISLGTPTTFNPKREYEEDFLYFRFLMDFAAERVPLERLADPLARWEALSGDEDPRLVFCRALLGKDVRTLEQTLVRMSDEKARKLRAEEEEERVNPDEAPLLPYLSMEVLTWVELATRAGLGPAPDLPLAPTTARLFHLARYPAPDSWRTPESYRSLPKPA